MNHSQAHFLRFSPAGLAGGFGRPDAADRQARDKPVECNVVVALEERMWRDRRETWVEPPVRGSAAARLRARMRTFVTRMQLGPVPDEAAGRDPEIRF